MHPPISKHVRLSMEKIGMWLAPKILQKVLEAKVHVKVYDL